MAPWSRRKNIDTIAQQETGRSLHRTLGWPHLLAIGIGSTIGTGIYTLLGVGADRAGPGVILAFAVAGIVCGFTALLYAELATMMPAAGSAYTYTYASIGEVAAWVIGWSLILEYALACAGVAVGWAAYFSGMMRSLGAPLPEVLLQGPHAGGWINLPAVGISAAATALLCLGTRESANVNIALVVLKLATLVVFVVLALPFFDTAHLTPFMPYGFSAHQVDGETRGVMAAAAIVFFAYFGFDTVSTSAEETKNPNRDLVIGIMGSMAVCGVFYMLVSGIAVAALPFADFAKSEEPMALILRTMNYPLVANAIAITVIIALPSVILTTLYGQTRIFFVMARDGLLPHALSSVHATRGTPVMVTILTGIAVALVGGLFSLDEIAELSNAGTLVAFASVGICVMVLRRRRPDISRAYRTPAVAVIGPLAVAGCGYLFVSLPYSTMIQFLIWNTIGLVVYLAYGMGASRLGRRMALDTQ
jgi:APA family basic amino acid/polyamine antiporter